MTSKNLDLNLLPIAFALYDELSVSRAARLLSMSQPAVSMALRKLREAFDDPLFVRVPPGSRRRPDSSPTNWNEVKSTSAVGYFPSLASKNFHQRRLSPHRFA